MDGVASRLGLGIRTLQRRLQAEGTVFRDIVSDFQKHRAQELLFEGDIPTSEIASALGFYEPNSFRRAFRRWTGMTPDQFRDKRSVAQVVA